VRQNLIGNDGGVVVDKDGLKCHRRNLGNKHSPHSICKRRITADQIKLTGNTSAVVGTINRTVAHLQITPILAYVAHVHSKAPFEPTPANKQRDHRVTIISATSRSA
jgi:hypothetical protein